MIINNIYSITATHHSMDHPWVHWFFHFIKGHSSPLLRIFLNPRGLGYSQAQALLLCFSAFRTHAFWDLLIDSYIKLLNHLIKSNLPTHTHQRDSPRAQINLSEKDTRHSKLPRYIYNRCLGCQMAHIHQKRKGPPTAFRL